MLKRCNHDDDNHHPARKRIRVARVEKADRISALSDELLLQILSFLPTTTLLLCQRLSRRFRSLAGDSELWKRQYYSRWVWPRTRRTANKRCTGLLSSKFNYTPKVSTWLDHGHLARGGTVTNWKKQYRLQHNWSRGICRVVEIEFPEPLRPPLLVKFCAGFVFVADSDYTLRIWEAGNPQSCLASIPATDSLDASTALAVGRRQQQNVIEVTVGFESGRFSLWTMDLKTLRLSLRFTHSGTGDGAITGIALSLPYILMISQHKVLLLYKVPLEKDKSGQVPTENCLLASLKADSILSPISLSVRIVGSQVIASIVYSFFHIGCGWSLGIQELHFNKTGQQKTSRLATTVESQHETMPFYSLHGESLSSLGRETTRGQQYARPSEPSILHRDPPTSVSYSHPYLLTSHADNTLTMYLVVSTAAGLSVKSGRRLWGHTSSVSAVQVSNRGKAVSISSRGGEVRIWELEALVSSPDTPRSMRQEISIPASPENTKIQEHSGGESRSHSHIFQASASMVSPAGRPLSELTQIRSCIGFDEERVLLLREMGLGGQLLEAYDFT